MHIPTFNKGLNRRLAPHLLDGGVSSVCTNVKMDSGSIESIKGPITTGTECKPSFIFDKNGDLISSDISTSYARLANIIYSTEEEGNFKYVEIEDELGNKTTQKQQMGIDKPKWAEEDDNLIVTLLDLSEDDPLEKVSFVAYTGGDLTPATYNYKIVQVNANINIRERDVSFNLTAPSNAVLFTIPDQGFIVRIYREVAGTYYLVDETAKGTIYDQTLDISNNTLYDTPTTTTGEVRYQMTYANSKVGTESEPTELTRVYNVTSEKLIQVSNIPSTEDPQVDKKYIYRLDEVSTIPVRVAELDATTAVFIDRTDSTLTTAVLESYSYQKLEKGYTGLRENYGVMYAFKDNRLRFSLTGSPEYWPSDSFIDFEDEVMGVNASTVGLLVHLVDKTYLLGGTSPADFTRQLVSDSIGCKTYKSCRIVNSVPVWVSKEGVNTYVNGQVASLTKEDLGMIDLDVIDTVVYNEAYFVLTSDPEEQVFVVDFKFNARRVYFENFGPNVQGINKDSGILYICKDDELQKCYEGDILQFDWKSGNMVDTIISQEKTYNRFHVFAEGIPEGETIELKIDVQGKVFDRTVKNGHNDIHIEAGMQRGYYISISFKGRGIIREVYYVGEPVGNGK